jgi:hypothetical protein
MSDRINISYCANALAEALLQAMKPGGAMTRADIDCIRSAVVGYLAGGLHRPSSQDVERLIDFTLRKFVEKCP